MDKGAWWATVHGGSRESDMTEAACAAQNSHFCSYQLLIYMFLFPGLQAKLIKLVGN